MIQYSRLTQCYISFFQHPCLLNSSLYIDSTLSQWINHSSLLILDFSNINHVNLAKLNICDQEPSDHFLDEGLNFRLNSKFHFINLYPTKLSFICNVLFWIILIWALNNNTTYKWQLCSVTYYTFFFIYIFLQRHLLVLALNVPFPTMYLRIQWYMLYFVTCPYSAMGMNSRHILPLLSICEADCEYITTFVSKQNYWILLT